MNNGVIFSYIFRRAGLLLKIYENMGHITEVGEVVSQGFITPMNIILRLTTDLNGI